MSKNQLTKPPAESEPLQDLVHLTVEELLHLERVREDVEAEGAALALVLFVAFVEVQHSLSPPRQTKIVPVFVFFIVAVSSIASSFVVGSIEPLKKFNDKINVRRSLNVKLYSAVAQRNSPYLGSPKKPLKKSLGSIRLRVLQERRN